MTPETLLQNATALVQAILPFGGGLAAVIGLACYGYGKAADSPNVIRWGKQAWIGAAVLWAGSPVIELIKNISQRIFA